ncbi:hypothetical protein [Williamsia sp. 1135]|uniref:hypothetical protein n=1 Tax=Williamsia sp. 1135 TaxID=1889262 RepID=UPI00197EF81B|nr:hypothetical protein [Williamsia sp. 1135]
MCGSAVGAKELPEFLCVQLGLLERREMLAFTKDETIHAARPAGESFSPIAAVCGLVRCIAA